MMRILSVVSRCPYLFKSFSDWVNAPLAFLISLFMLDTVDEDFTKIIIHHEIYND